MDPNPKIGALMRKGNLNRETGDRERRQLCEDGGKTGVVLPPAKDHQGPPEAGRGQEGPSPRGFRGSMALEAP